MLHSKLSKELILEFLPSTQQEGGGVQALDQQWCWSQKKEYVGQDCRWPLSLYIYRCIYVYIYIYIYICIYEYIYIYI